MQEIRNLDNKRVCDLSDDKKSLFIVRGECLTTFTVDDEGFLQESEDFISQMK